ncbi:AIR synthase family protein [Thermococcus sp.]|uniref:AIR synthase family protein n=1 Tax=Thermococcus sp. TaxID=35749 RepID=UPI002612CD4A|nr:AIR synthase family protein [Thermococcus sp.]
MSKLPVGKVRDEALRRVILPNLGVEDERIVYGPRSGFDAAVLEYDDESYLVIATDPVVGVPREAFGFFTYHFAASDLAVFGVEARWLVINLLFPEGTEEAFLREVMEDLNEECRRFGGSVVGGHTGVYPGASEPTATTTALGLVKKSDLKLPLARPGDRIVVTAKVGLEFAVSAAYFRKGELLGTFSKRDLMRLKRSFYFETVLPDALIARPFVRGMHDATEGGLTALHEIADNSGVGFRVYSHRLQLDPLVRRVLDFYGLEPWSVSSSGTLIAITPPEKVGPLIEELNRNGILAFEIGTFTEKRERILVEKGEDRPFPKFEGDPYAMLHGKAPEHLAKS